MNRPRARSRAARAPTNVVRRRWQSKLEAIDRQVTATGTRLNLGHARQAAACRPRCNSRRSSTNTEGTHPPRGTPPNRETHVYAGRQGHRRRRTCVGTAVVRSFRCSRASRGGAIVSIVLIAVTSAIRNKSANYRIGRACQFVKSVAYYEVTLSAFGQHAFALRGSVDVSSHTRGY